MSIADSQKHTFLRLIAPLRPSLRTEPSVPSRFENILRVEKGLGSRDRRLYRELFYTLLRCLPWLEAADDEALASGLAFLCAESPATRPFKQSFADESGFRGRDRAELLPPWLREECPEAFDPARLDLLLSRAPLWLRIAPGRGESLPAELAAEGIVFSFSKLLSSALRIEGEKNLTQNEAFLRGDFEVQDISSQLVLESCPITQGGRWLDACAGAGGKTLQLAAMLGSSGRIDAQDPRTEALRELALRARRAGLQVEDRKNIAPTLSRTLRSSSPCAVIALRPGPGAPYDGVLVDAPCSGSGTWRRSPQLKWSTGPRDVARSAALQSELLERHCTDVAPGGLLVYSTCSLCRSENEAVANAFLLKHKDFEQASLVARPGLVPQGGFLRLWPWLGDGDGLFVACLRRRS